MKIRKMRGLDIFVFVLVIIFFGIFSFAAPLINFIIPSSNHSFLINPGSLNTTFNLTLNESSLGNFTWHWNGTNYTIYDNSLVLYYNFDNVSAIGENGTLIVDVSRNGSNGTYMRPDDLEIHASGKYGLAAELTAGSDDYIQTPLVISTLPITFSLWIYSYDSADRHIISNDNGAFDYSLTQSSGVYLIGDGNSGVSTGVSVVTNQWVYLTAVINSSFTGLYKDGVLVYSTGAGASASSPPAFTIGSRAGFNDLYFNGKVDEVMIFNRSLNAAEIQQLYWSNLAKINAQNWSFYSSQRVPEISGQTYNTTYYSCARNISGFETCTDIRILETPSLNPGINFTSPLLANNTQNNLGNLYFNVSINNASDLGTLKFNLNGTNYTRYNNSLVLMLNFDNVSAIGENDTTFVDVSQNGNNGSCSGASCPTFNATGKYGGAMQFDNTNDYITFPTLNITGSVSAGAWVYSSNFADEMFIVQKAPVNGQWEIFFENTALKWRGGSATSVNCNLPANNQWHHVFGTQTGTTARVYIDGVLCNSGSVTAIGNGNGLIWIGAHDGPGYYFNGLIDEVLVYNQSLSAAEVQQIYLSSFNKYTQNNWSFFYNNTNLSDGNHNYSVWISDLAGNSNSTETFYYTTDRTPPVISNIFYSPNSTDNVDPNVDITLNSTVVDALIGIDEVYYEIYNGTAWSNLSATNTSSMFNLSYTLQNNEVNYTYRVFANDTLGNSNRSANRSIAAYWDCSWNITPVSGDLGSIGGFNQEKELGNVTLNNTGDVNYSNSNCTIKFARTSAGAAWYRGTSYNQDGGSTLNFSTAYYLDGGTGLRYYEDGSSITSVVVAAGENKTLTVKGMYPSGSVLQEYPYFPIFANITDSVDGDTNKTIKAKMVVTSIAYLETAIETPSSSALVVYLTPQNISLESYIKNIAYTADSDQNTTAHNVSFNWTLSSDLANLVLVGDLNNSYSVLNDTDKRYNNLTLSLNSSNLGELSQGSYNATIYGFGYENSSGNLTLISHSNNQTILSDSLTITLLCYPTADNVTISACGSLDGDYVAPSTSSSSSSSGGGGGGGGAAGESAASRADYEITRGKQNEIDVMILNKNSNYSMENVEFRISGDIAKYITYSPTKIDSIGPGDEKKITLKITSPAFLPTGKQLVYLDISAQQNGRPYSERKTIVIQINEISKEDAAKLLAESEELMKKFESEGFKSNLIEKLFNDSKEAYLLLEYGQVNSNYEVIKEIVTNGIDAKSTIEELRRLIEIANEKGITTSGSQRVLGLAVLSLERGEYEQAFQRATEARTTYALEIAPQIARFSYQIKENSRAISIGAIVGLVLLYFAIRFFRFRKIENDIKRLKHEEVIIDDLIRVIQKQTFKDGKMDMDEYNEALHQYQLRIAKITAALIELESARRYHFKFTREDQKLKEQRKILIDMIKEAQHDYLTKKSIEQQTYQLRLKTYDKKIAEIDEKLASLEAKKVLKGAKS